MLGKLSWSAIPIDQPIPMLTSAVVALAILGVLAWVVVKGHLPYLWNEWITSVDHKRIGVLYLVSTLLALFLGGAFALTRLLKTMLFGIGVTDPLTFLAAPLGLMLVVLLATFLPAFRATRISPVVALRYE